MKSDLVSNEEKFRVMAETSPAAIFIYDDIEEKFQYVNHAAVSITGYTRDELLRLNVLHLIHPSMQEVVAMRKQARMEGKITFPARFEVLIQRKDDEVRWLDYSANKMVLEGKPVIMGIAFNVTDRKQAELALTSSEERFRVLAESMQCAMFIYQKNGFTYANPAITSLSGYTPEEMMKLTIPDLIHPDMRDLVVRRGKESLEGKPVPSRYELKIVCKDGTSRWVDYAAGNTTIGGEPAVLGVAIDITEHKQIITQLQKAKEEAERANHAKSDFLSRMSHELRTPMNSIMGFSQILAQEKDTLSEEQRHALHQIQDSGQHLLDLINEVLDLSRIEAGKLDMYYEDVELDEIITRCLSLVRQRAQRKGITLHYHKPGPLRVWADRIRCQELLLNLLSNAVKYNQPEGSVTITCHPVAGGTVHVDITNTGTPIPPEDQAQLFQPFTRFSQKKYLSEGTGIGLSICKHLVEAMGGQIGFRANSDSNTFWFELPPGITRTSGKPAIEPADPPETPAAIISTKGKVFYIEDTPANFSLMRMVFKRLPGLELKHAPTAEEGIQLIRQDPPDLILMDIGLPDMDGVEALQVLRADEKTRHIPAIAISAAVMPHDIARINNAGFEDYIKKPFNIQEIPAVIAKFLS